MSTENEPADHTGIVSFANEDLQSMLILKWYFHIQRVRIVDFPQEVTVVKGLKGRIEFSSMLLHR